MACAGGRNSNDDDDDDDDFIETRMKMRLVRPLAIKNANVPRKNIY